MKSTKSYDRIRSMAIKWTAEKLDISREYVRAAIYGTYTGGRTEEILAAYKKKYAELKAVLK